jgi:rRNA maturation endonuclease Nob1
MNPKPRDLPRDELIIAADEALKRYPGSEIHFKFTCEHCGRRCMLADPNCLYERGICDNCGKETVISQGGFTLITSINSTK